MDIILTLSTLLVYALLGAVLCIVLVSVLVYATTSPYPVVDKYNGEDTFLDVKTNQMIKFPCIEDNHEVNLSVVVPAYNEEERLAPMLDETLAFLEDRVKRMPNYKYEIIVVSDGSKDNTVGVAHSYTDRFGSDKVRCLQLVKNRGKGGAVRLGVECARGASVLFADADGASKFEDITKLEQALAALVQGQEGEGADAVALVVGSRAHLEDECLATRSVFRNVLMYGFKALVRVLVRGVRVRDSQCGFKLLTRRAARLCFRSLHVTGWAFDVELLYIAAALGVRVAEVPVRWTEVAGSKVTPVLAWAQMGADLALIWLKYTTRAWKIRHH